MKGEEIRERLRLLADDSRALCAWWDIVHLRILEEIGWREIDLDTVEMPEYAEEWEYTLAVQQLQDIHRVGARLLAEERRWLEHQDLIIFREWREKEDARLRDVPKGNARNRSVIALQSTETGETGVPKRGRNLLSALHHNDDGNPNAEQVYGRSLAEAQSDDNDAAWDAATARRRGARILPGDRVRWSALHRAQTGTLHDARMRDSVFLVIDCKCAPCAAGRFVAFDGGRHASSEAVVVDVGRRRSPDPRDRII